MTQKGHESYGNDASAGATDISQSNNHFFNTVAELDESITKESVEMVQSQRSMGLTNLTMGTAAKIDSEGIEESAAIERSHTEINIIDQTMGDVNAIFGGGINGSNNSAPPLAPRMLVIAGNASSTMTKHAMAFLSRGKCTQCSDDSGIILIIQ